MKFVNVCISLNRMPLLPIRIQSAPCRIIPAGWPSLAGRTISLLRTGTGVSYNLHMKPSRGADSLWKQNRVEEPEKISLEMESRFCEQGLLVESSSLQSCPDQADRRGKTGSDTHTDQPIPRARPPCAPGE